MIKMKLCVGICLPTARQVWQFLNGSKLTLKNHHEMNPSDLHLKRSEPSLWCSPGWTQVPWLRCSKTGGPVKMGRIQDGSKIQKIYLKVDEC